MAEALDTTDCVLHRRIEILHAEAGAIDTGVSESLDMAPIEMARIDLDGDLGVGGDAKVSGNPVRDRHEVARRKHRRGAASPVDVCHARLLVHAFGDEVQFAQQELCVVRDAIRSVADARVAAAITAERLAERNVQVE